MRGLVLYFVGVGGAVGLGVPRGSARARRVLMAKAALIEVEKKFEGADPSVLEDAVLRHGGEKVGSVAFTDTYYDTAACALTRRDIWLRQRNDEWELKVPAEADAKRSGGERTVFIEVEGEVAVRAALADVDPALRSDDVADLAALLRDRDCVAFASFGTTRSRYKLGAAKIDADSASFGHSVLEIEIMVADAAQIPEAELEIARVAALVGARPLQKASGGKLETYIRRFAPAVHATLVEAGILS